MIEILKYTLPALIVLAATYLVMTKQLRAETARQLMELKKNQAKDVMPIRLRGYERLALLLERTSPENMLLNMNLPELTCLELQTNLLGRIRQEYEHNASQQIYVSYELWHLIRSSKEGLLHLVNTCAVHTKPEEPAFKLAEIIIKTYNYTPDNPTAKAVEYLQTEVKKMF